MTESVHGAEVDGVRLDPIIESCGSFAFSVNAVRARIEAERAEQLALERSGS